MIRYLILIFLLSFISIVFAHGVADRDALFIQQNPGIAIIPFMYLGAKHMITGYDHLLYLLGVIFFLNRIKDIVFYVTLFALGHSITLILGVLSEINVNVYLVDTVIGVSVVYKAFENLGGFREFFKFSFDPKVAVFFFGLFHGLGLATKLQSLVLSTDGLVINILSFNFGVEIGQLLALTTLLAFINMLKITGKYKNYSEAINVGVLFSGFLLISYQLSSFFFLTM